MSKLSEEEFIKYTNELMKRISGVQDRLNYNNYYEDLAAYLVYNTEWRNIIFNNIDPVGLDILEKKVNELLNSEEFKDKFKKNPKKVKQYLDDPKSVNFKYIHPTVESAKKRITVENLSKKINKSKVKVNKNQNDIDFSNACNVLWNKIPSLESKEKKADYIKDIFFMIESRNSLIEEENSHPSMDEIKNNKNVFIVDEDIKELSKANIDELVSKYKTPENLYQEYQKHGPDYFLPETTIELQGNTNAKKAIEDIQREIKRLPANTLEGNIEGKNKLIDNVKNILAIRIGVNSVLGKGSSLDKTRDGNSEAKILNDLNKNKLFTDWIEKKVSYKDLRKFAASGHGGQIEKEFTKYLCTIKTIPDDIPERFMPTAKERIEGLQKNLKEAMKAGEAKKITQFMKEIIATRKAVNAKRGGDGLKGRINKDLFKNAMNDNELNEDIVKLVNDYTGTNVKKRNDAQATIMKAIEGHGGRFMSKLEEMHSEKKITQAPTM
ncbi:MAG: hypothetical protein K5894_09815 [Lachnospiraceae bacterium]|nr:hypothetical protein [Lachnospiraceae bacterium]